MNVETLVELLSRQAQQFGEKRAFCFLGASDGGEVSLTFRALHERAMAIGGELQARCQPGDRVWLLFPPGLEAVAAFFGCLYAGVVAVPVSPPRARRQACSLSAVLGGSQPAAILTTAEHQALAANQYAELPALLSRPWIATDRIPDDRQTSWTDPGAKGRDLAFLQYTSGSTSAPKGVMVTHRNLLENSALIQQSFGTSEDHRGVFWLPLYHDMGLIGGVLQPLYCGGTSSLFAPAAFLQRPRLWLETISATRATISGGPDFAYDLCARKIGPAERAGLDLSSWKVAFTGAEPIRAATLDRFAEAFADCGFRREAFFPCYGLAEATLMVSGGPRWTPPTVLHVDPFALSGGRIREVPGTAASRRSLVASGTCLPGQEVAIVDPATRLPCSAETVGEIWVHGACVAEGYYQQPEATAHTFGGALADRQNGKFLRTGDLGFVRDGRLFVTGRLKDVIIIRGRNYYPEDIELTVEAADPRFRAGRGVAFSVEVEDLERLVVVQELEPRVRTLDAEAAMQAVRQAVSTAHEVEVYAIVLTKAGAIPTTTSGKRRRSACREQYLTGQLEVIAQWTAKRRNGHSQTVPASGLRVGPQHSAKDVEHWLVRRIAAQLGVAESQIHVQTPFLELGMGSLDAMEVASDLQNWLGRRLSPTAIYNYPNISALSKWLTSPATVTRTLASRETPGARAEALDPNGLLRDVQRLTEAEMEAYIVRELERHRQP